MDVYCSSTFSHNTSRTGSFVSVLSIALAVTRSDVPCCGQQELRIIGVMITLFGIMYFSVVLGFIVDGIRSMVDSVKQGRTKVAEGGHTVSVSLCCSNLAGTYF